MAILDISKKLSYDFYYNRLKVKYGSKCKLAYTDTDSLLFEMKTDDFYIDMLATLDDYDTNDYPKTSELHSTKNKKVPGK